MTRRDLVFQSDNAGRGQCGATDNQRSECGHQDWSAGWHKSPADASGLAPFPDVTAISALSNGDRTSFGLRALLAVLWLTRREIEDFDVCRAEGRFERTQVGRCLVGLGLQVGYGV